MVRVSAGSEIGFKPSERSAAYPRTTNSKPGQDKCHAQGQDRDCESQLLHVVLPSREVARRMCSHRTHARTVGAFAHGGLTGTLPGRRIGPPNVEEISHDA